MRSLSCMTGVAAGALLIGGILAPAAHANEARQHTCEQAGGTYTAGSLPGQDRCVVTTTSSITGPYGRPTTTDSEPRPDGTSPFYTDGPTAATGEPAAEAVLHPVGGPSSDSEEVAGTPVTTTRTEEHAPTSVAEPGTRDCRRITNERGARKVEKCERTVVTTTTTPTTVHTTVTTPQERVTTTTQPQHECVTTTQPTAFTRTTTQNQVKDQTISYNQRTLTTTTTTTYRYDGRHALQLVVFQTAPNPRSVVRTTEAEPWTSTTTVGAPQLVTTEQLLGKPIVAGPSCSPTDPAITVRRAALDPVVETTSAPGAPIITTTVQGTGETCYRNPSSTEQRDNAC